VGIVRKKLNFRLFLLASIIGKTIVYAPVIFIWKWILTLFNIK
jgi:membrane protein YqaA with SNARE-associated domain